MNLSGCLDSTFIVSAFSVLRFPLILLLLLLLNFFFFFTRVRETNFTIHILFTHYSHTVHKTHSHFIQENKNKNKNGSYGTIHTFKNYFATVFSVFSKISCIHMDP